MSSNDDVPIPPSDPPAPAPASLFPDDDPEDDIVSSDDYDYDNDNDDEPEPIPDIPSPPATLPLPPPPPPPFSSAVASAATPPDRRLFQRLWTDEDEIELLQGFHDYTVSRGGVHHHDTAAFYDQIKTKLQLEFNKNQLVEKLRRLKKKYRNVLNKMTNSVNGRDFVFKSPHDHATFQISNKIWSNLTPNSNPNSRPVSVSVGVGGNALAVVESHTSNDVNITTSANNNNINNTTPVKALNTGSPGGGGGGGFDGSSDSGLSKMLSRKRPRVAAPPKVEEKIIKIEGGFVNNNNNNLNLMNNNNNQLSNVSVSSQLQEMVEETVRNCLSPVLKNLINTATTTIGTGAGAVSPDGGEIPGFKGVGALALNAAPMNFTGCFKVQGGMDDDKWRKQQIMELEVYSKRLELVQDQIKSSLDELRSMET